jgi:hypothetical protein
MRVEQRRNPTTANLQLTVAQAGKLMNVSERMTSLPIRWWWSGRWSADASEAIDFYAFFNDASRCGLHSLSTPSLQSQLRTEPATPSPRPNQPRTETPTHRLPTKARRRGRALENNLCLAVVAEAVSELVVRCSARGRPRWQRLTAKTHHGREPTGGVSAAIPPRARGGPRRSPGSST